VHTQVESCEVWKCGVFFVSISEFVSSVCYISTHLHLGIVLKCVARTIIIKTVMSAVYVTKIVRFICNMFYELQ